MPDDDSSSRESTKRLGAWFLGPKAENGALEEEMILHILRDYFHWRRNYYPSDEIIVTQQMRRESLAWSDALFQQLTEMLARLKRHFPFYSPRYVAHMLSDQTIPSVLGYFAGMLYNPNNVTPEAAPVTVDWELEVAADILKMVGYRPPPPAGAHHRETRAEFGWAHITSGGTVANLEALWVARNIRYLPLAIRHASRESGVAITVKVAGLDEPQPVSTLDDRQLLGLKPNSAIFLLPRFIHEVQQQLQLPSNEAVRRVWEWMAASGFLLSQQGTARCFSERPPVLFVSDTAHYSVAKSADILGLGKDNVVLVDVDPAFRLDVCDLERKLLRTLDEGRYPLAVVAIAGTTEEGAVDPVHEIDALRQRLEQSHQYSFWLHVDAAWAGYVRSLFVGPETVPDGPIEDQIHQVNEFTSRTLDIRRNRYQRSVELRWGSQEVCRAFLAFPRAESITIDPHKMGYVPYPCGVVAFRNDRVRHVLIQEAPYISVTTQAGTEESVYHPPTNVGPFILEGSKPGAAAASCWLSHRMIPPDRSGYGEIVRASLLAARELYERLIHWEASCRANHEPVSFHFVPATSRPPDTNMVCFVVKAEGCDSLSEMNALGESVYQRFTIQAELGDRDYSYSQPFFLSRTQFRLPQYSPDSVADLLARAGVAADAYPDKGIFVLRATVMSPYIVLSAETGHRQALLAEFTETLAATVGECIGRIPAEGS